MEGSMMHADIVMVKISLSFLQDRLASNLLCCYIFVKVVIVAIFTYILIVTFSIGREQSLFLLVDRVNVITAVGKRNQLVSNFA